MEEAVSPSQGYWKPEVSPFLCEGLSQAHRTGLVNSPTWWLERTTAWSRLSAVSVENVRFYLLPFIHQFIFSSSLPTSMNFAYSSDVWTPEGAVARPGQLKAAAGWKNTYPQCCPVHPVRGGHRGRVPAFRKLLQWARSSGITCLVLQPPESSSCFQGQCSVTLPSRELWQHFISCSHRHFSAFGHTM